MAAIQNIIVPTDLSEPSRAAVARAAWIARLEGAAIHLVHALRFPMVGGPYDVSVPGAVWQEVRRGVREELEKIRKDLEASGIASVSAVVSEAVDPFEPIEAAIQEKDADLVVMGTHGYGGIQKALLGSVAARTVRQASCPVLAVKGDEQAASAPIRRILVPIDFSEPADAAVALAAGLAKTAGASLEILHAVDFAPEYAAHLPADAMEIEEKMRSVGTERLEGIARDLQGSGVEVALHIVRDAPVNAIRAEAERLDVDLIVMGTHGRRGVSHLLLGSVAERTLQTAPCSVLCVKGSAKAGADG